MDQKNDRDNLEVDGPDAVAPRIGDGVAGDVRDVIGNDDSNDSGQPLTKRRKRPDLSSADHQPELVGAELSLFSDMGELFECLATGNYAEGEGG